MYTTYPKIQARFPNASLDASLVNSYIEEATAWINEVTATTFAPTISSATPRIYSTMVLTDTIVIDYAYQVDTVEFLTGRTAQQDTWAVVDPTTYRVTPENTTPKSGIQFIDSLGLNYPIYFEGNTANVRITAIWGYSSTVPKDIERIATQYVINMLREDGIIRGVVSTEKIGDASITYDSRQQENSTDKLLYQLAKYRDVGDIRV